ncbi:hypothetical protein QJ854_gp376 [Moumouvirus goulette]|uniref:Uncharacterized protein n=1 Tax=Moumouvirus goulette TaxID=1247379 RepID=M1PN53_9VIRU|nr:hypothetical protein QJ854_gp376 [Moumouvirus goulette]AGF85406.1 hypothetical protein glt_00597 [Moumouvirus goulette]
MDNIINIGMFIQHLTYYIKVGIYINKGTSRDSTLEKCINLHNKLKSIENSKEISTEDETFVRKCLKRLNLLLKVDDDDNPVDIRKKENQLKMIYFSGHKSLSNNKLNDMITHANKYDLNILSDIPLTFILRESKYRDLLWQYTRSLFYISQMLITKTDPNAEPTKINIIKRKIFDESAKYLEDILVQISDIEEAIEMNKIMAADKFLSSKLKEGTMTNEKVSEATQEVKELFSKKGLGENNAMVKMIDSISSKLNFTDLSSGNAIQNIFSIAQNVANELRGDLEGDPESFKRAIGAVTEIFQETIDDPTGEKNIPTELKSMIDTIIPAITTNNHKSQDNILTDDVAKKLSELAENNNLDKDEFLNSIRGESDTIDISKLENILAGLNNLNKN